MFGLLDLGIIGLLILFIIALFIPLFLILVVGIGFANLLGFTGITWWAFVILFYFIMALLIAKLGA